MNDTHVTLADFINGVMSFGSLVLICFVFYTLLQVAKVVREEFVEKQEKRFERWYAERIQRPQYPTDRRKEK